MEQDAKTLKGLGTAICIIATIGLVLSLIVVALLGAGIIVTGDVAVNDPSALSITDLSSEEAAEVESDLGVDLSDGQAAGATAIAFMGLSAATVVGSIIFELFILIAGTRVRKGAQDFSKLGGAFGWSIAGAILSFLGANIITLVLFIIAAVKANGMKKQQA